MKPLSKVHGYVSTADYTRMDAPQMLEALQADGYAWADAFRQLNPDCNVGDEALVSWFCNACQNSLDVASGSGLVVLPDGSGFFTA